jgi:uncharacterized protein involved in exopolysaccharide biosynthesis
MKIQIANEADEHMLQSTTDHQVTTKFVETGADRWVSVSYFLKRVVKKWPVSLAICAICIASGIGLMNLFPKTYESRLIMSPKDNPSPGSALGSFSSLYASMFGSDSKINLLMNVIQSERLAARLMQSDDYLHVVFKAQWDDSAQKWHPPTSTTASIIAFLRRMGGLEEWYPPDAKDLSNYLSKNIKVEPDKQSGAFILTLADQDPAFAQRLLHAAYAGAEGILSQEEIERSKARLQYFDGILQNSTNLNLKTTVISLADSERQHLVVLQSGEQVASDLVQDATLPLKPSSPSLVIFMAIGLFFGILISVFVTAKVLK